MNPEQYFKKDNIGGLLMSIQGIPKGDPMHRYFEFLEPRVGAISQASLTLTNLYLPGLRQSIRKWREDKRKFKIYNGDLKRESKEFNYLSISEFIRRNWYFEHKEFDLPWLHECWLDHTNNHRMNFHRRVDDKPWISFTDGDLDKVYNEKFPVTPSIGREGILLSSFFEPLIDRIIKKRIKLVESSHEALSLDWIFELKDLINDTVSSVDILLNTIYTKAELDPLPKWTFSKQKLGEKHARRLTDKIKWIFQIGGQHLDISKESNSLTFLKELRNHLNHFDPPCFCATLEEIANWLNMITDIGVIHLKIREALSLKPST
ncbi:MAG: hypothetical protein EOP04_30215, partial [Proteobacteria bacterium]